MFTNNPSIDRSKLTFSQAEGIDPLPQPTMLGELSPQVRNILWSHIFESLEEARYGIVFKGDRGYLGQPWKKILYDFHVANSQLADELDRTYVSNFESIKKLLIEEKYNRVFDFVEFVLRHELTPTTLSKSVAQVFDDGMCAYTIIEDGRILSIVPVAIPEQRESIEKAFEALASDPFGGARSHLFKSAKCINSGDHAGSVRESIHAVESVARRLDTGSRKSLAPALAALSKKGVVLHGAFKSGIEKLYGYSSDVDGIRHSLLEKNAKVDVEDAVFMFGACASFARAARKVSQNAGRFLTHPSSAEGV